MSEKTPYHCCKLTHLLIRTSTVSYEANATPIGSTAGIELATCLRCKTSLAKPEPAETIAGAVEIFLAN